MVCLDRAKRAFRATGALVTSAEETEFSRLALVAQALPRADHCLDLKAMTEVDPPAPDLAERSAAIEQDLAEVIVLLEGGKFDEARKRARVATEQATSLGYQPLIAEAKLLDGRANLLLLKNAAAVPLLAEASEVAFAAGADRIGVEAWARWAYVTGMRGDTASPLAGVAVVRALATRIGKETFSSVLLENNIGTIHIAAGNHERARSVLKGAAKAARNLEGPGVIEAMYATGNLAMVTKEGEARDRLAAESVTRLRKLLGDVHPHVLRAVHDQAQLAKPKLAVSLLQPTCELWRTYHPQLKADAARCFKAALWFYDLVGDSASASAAAAQVIRLAESRHPVSVGLNSLFEGEFKKAIETMEPLTVEYEGASETLAWWDTLNYAELLMVIGRSHQQLGNRRGAETLEKARALLLEIKNPLPVVTNRIRTAERWIKRP